MKANWVLLFVLLKSVFCFSQIEIEGWVINTNKEPLFGASVYVDGTTIGTTTDDKGYFKLQLPYSMNSILVVRYFGYTTAYQNIKKESNSIYITLNEEVKALKEVVVQRNQFTRADMLKLFKEQFLGINKAGSNCIIENEDELYFDYDTKNFVFKAYADKPLEIKNNYLNYKIQYQLIDFECQFYKLSIKSLDVINALYAGTSYFTEINNDTKYVKRRKKSYEGSSLHFFRNLIEKKWSKKEFILFEGSFMTSPDTHFEISNETNAIYKIEVAQQKKNTKNNFVAEFSILFNNKEQSKISFFTDTFYVDRFGQFTDYDKIYFSGDITSRKIGDLLPTNYGL